MRRLAIAILGAGLLLTQAGLAFAADGPVTITFGSAQLAARGAGVYVTYEVVCEPAIGWDGQPVYDFAADSMGTNARIRQAVSKTLIATGEGSVPYQTPIRCDGSTVNVLTMLVTADTVPFRKGPAIIWLGAALYDPTYMADGYFSWIQFEGRITK